MKLDCEDLDAWNELVLRDSLIDVAAVVVATEFCLGCNGNDLRRDQRGIAENSPTRRCPEAGEVKPMFSRTKEIMHSSQLNEGQDQFMVNPGKTFGSH